GVRPWKLWKNSPRKRTVIAYSVSTETLLPPHELTPILRVSSRDSGWAQIVWDAAARIAVGLPSDPGSPSPAACGKSISQGRTAAVLRQDLLRTVAPNELQERGFRSAAL